MVDLPTPVKKQLAQIEELYKQPAATPAEGAEGGQLPADETPAPDAAQPVVEPAQDAPAPAAEAPTEAPAPAPAQDPNPWEQRYKTLQGLHNRNVEDLKGRVKARDAEIAEMRKQIAELQAARSAPAVDPRDAETFGEDLVAMVQRVVEARLGHSGAQTDSRMADLESRLEGTTNAVAQGSARKASRSPHCIERGAASAAGQAGVFGSRGHEVLRRRGQGPVRQPTRRCTARGSSHQRCARRRPNPLIPRLGAHLE